MQTTLDLNADVGEGFGRWDLGDDAGLLQVVSSANVACGFHAGDPKRLLAVCELAVAGGVAIGAQISYRDLAGFGRRFIEVDPADLEAEAIYQIGALDALARRAGGRVGYVKPHGALYNAVFRHEAQASAVARAVAGFTDADGWPLPVLGQDGSALFRAAAQLGVQTVAEAFADRGYRSDGSLVPRGQAGDLLTDPDRIAARVVLAARTGSIEAVDGNQVRFPARSFCVHGDTVGAVVIARQVRAALAAAGVATSAFTALA